MDVTTIIAFVVYGYFMYYLGKSTIKSALANKSIQAIVDRTKFPVGVVEKIEGQYYLYEKDTTNFLCQAERLEDIPMKLWETKQVSLAAIMCPEESNQIFWCVNGKLKAINL